MASRVGDYAERDREVFDLRRLHGPPPFAARDELQLLSAVFACHIFFGLAGVEGRRRRDAPDGTGSVLGHMPAGPAGPGGWPAEIVNHHGVHLRFPHVYLHPVDDAVRSTEPDRSGGTTGACTGTAVRVVRAEGGSYPFEPAAASVPVVRASLVLHLHPADTRRIPRRVGAGEVAGVSVLVFVSPYGSTIYGSRSPASQRFVLRWLRLDMGTFANIADNRRC